MRSRSRLRIVVPLAVLAVAGVLAPASAAADPPARELVAYLDGRPLPLRQVGDHFCDDFAYPVINCYSDPEALETRTSALLSVLAVDYVTVYDYTGFAGSYMHMSQNYTVLFLIGWNDRISSFRGRNNEWGRFWTDWFNSGTPYYFCCNQLVSSLGSYDNTFSSAERL